MADIKACLKEARENIKNKDYKSALRECKKVLNKDKNNYMALVFCGVSLSELDQPDQALQAYKKATESSPDQPVAWEGLHKFYDKHKKSVDTSHYLEVLQRLVGFYEDDVRYFEISSKLAQLQLEKSDLDGSVQTLSKQAEKCSGDIEKYRDSLASLIKVLTSQPSLSDDQNMILLSALEKSVTDNQTPNNMENLKHMIKLQYKLKNIEALVTTAVRMISIFTENIYPLEWICKVYLETVAGLWTVNDELFTNIETYSTNLKAFSENNSLATLAHGAFLFKNRNFRQCCDVMKSVTNVQNPNFYGLYILCQAFKELRDDMGIEATAEEALKHTGKVKDENKRQEFIMHLQREKVEAIYNQFNVTKLTKCVGIIENVGLVSLTSAKVFATLGKTEEAEHMLAQLKESLTGGETQLVKALILKSKNDNEQFVQTVKSLLLEDQDNFEATVLLAQMLFDLGEKEESFGLFLRSAKLNPSHWLPFLYLGKHYNEQATEASTDKARKCFQKSLQLSSNSNVEAATALSDILRVQGRHQENLLLLSQVTKEAGVRGGATWAWLRLGVHYLSVDQPGLAVTSLQSALRAAPDHVVCWEALGDAYVARGSYVAARKAFEKVLTMCPGSVYSKLMIADIRQKLGYHQEAIQDYEDLLSSSPDYLPALRGLAETFIAQAGVFLQEFVDENVVDCVEQSVRVLTRAAQLRPGLAGTWRLVGEACSLVTSLSEEMVKVRLPSVLLRQEATEDSQDSCDKTAVMELGIRCFTKSLVLEGDNASTWHDMGLLQAAVQQLDHAVMSLKKAISLDSRQGQFWSSLGLVFTRQENWSLAQHCFIKSLELESTAQCWTNLGVVYLNIGEHSLANKAFKEAQNTEPDYIRGWTGQALLAEIAGVKTECMDLFRHCTFLGPEPESARGYGDWVCSTLQSLEDKVEVEPHNRYILDKMYGVSVGVDSLAAYTRRYPGDVTAQCQYGVLCEKKGLVRTAQQAMAKALVKVQDQAEKDKILANLGRLLNKLERYEEAVTSYSSISSPTFHSQVGLAMAHYNLANYQASYQAYDSCLHWLADNDALKSHILVAMGNLAYKVEGMEAAKTLLFQSCQLSPPSVRGLFALCVIGVQHSDMNLIEAALSEMIPHENDPRFAADVAFLRASILVLKGDVKGAKKSLLSAVHQQPWLAKLWSSLSLFLLQNCPRDAMAASRLASKAGVMRQGNVDGGDSDGGVDTEVLATIALMMAGDRETSVKRASAACHMYPHLAESWAVLVAAARMGQSPATSASWISRVTSHVSRLSTENSSLSEWATRVAASL